MTTSKPQARRGRPPKVARSFDDTREALLHCGMEVLTEQGFAATGIDAVLTVSYTHLTLPTTPYV